MVSWRRRVVWRATQETSFVVLEQPRVSKSGFGTRVRYSRVIHETHIANGRQVKEGAAPRKAL